MKLLFSLPAFVLVYNALLVRAAEPGYCLYAPSDNCWPQGWPECCLDNIDANCPAQQPECTVAAPGSSICSRAPNYDCYEGGFPPCCQELIEDAPSCPSDGTYPACTITTTTAPGSSYCLYSPLKLCYTTGWPACCSNQTLTCPETEPACELPNYCSHAPNFQCWTGGHPACCETDGGSACPDEQPACTVTPVNVDTPCQQEADFTCYKNGFPACCQAVSPVCGDQASGDLNCDLLYATGTGSGGTTADGVDQATVGGRPSESGTTTSGGGSSEQTGPAEEVPSGAEQTGPSEELQSENPDDSGAPTVKGMMMAAVLSTWMMVAMACGTVS